MPESPGCSVTCTLAEWLSVGPAIVRLLPTLASVRLTDRLPGAWSEGLYWSSKSLPAPIFNGLKDAAISDGCAFYVIEDIAAPDALLACEADLSQACLAWARQQPTGDSIAYVCREWARSTAATSVHVP